MKKVLFMLSFAMAIMLGFISCDKDASYPVEVSDCSVFVRTTPGVETVLLARSGLPYTKAFDDILADFRTQYGKEDVSFSNGIPHPSKLGSIPNCYEITMTADVNDSWSWPMVQRGKGDVRIYKFYEWSYSGEGLDKYIEWLKNIYEEYDFGTIISTSKKKLGPEVHNMPIIF